MAKLNIPLSCYNDNECQTLFTSVVEKLNIANPNFYSPIFKKIVAESPITPGMMLDSKYKCREIISKIIDDSDDSYSDDGDAVSDGDGYETVDDTEDDNTRYTFDIEHNKNKSTEADSTNTDDILPTDQIDISEMEKINNPLKNIKNEIKHDGDDNNNGNGDGNGSDDGGDDDGGDDDGDDGMDNEIDNELEEALSNIYSVVARIEKKVNGNEPVITDEIIHIKKTPLLEPLKVLKDEYVIPSRIENKQLIENTETWQNTQTKLNCYNNSAYVESLFLYLGNKLVENGKCPSFPYYYGSINGEDANYYHDITDEYDSIGRTKWFRNRIKTDFDLLVIEGDELDEEMQEMENRQHRPMSGINYSRNKFYSGMNNESIDEQINDDVEIGDSESDIESDPENIDKMIRKIIKDSESENTNTIESIMNDTTLTNKMDQPDQPDLSDLPDITNVPLDDDNMKRIFNKQSGKTPFVIDDIDTLNDNILNLDLNLEANESTESNENNQSIENNESIEELIQSGGSSGSGNDSDSSHDSNFIEQLSDVDPDNMNLEDFEHSSRNYYYLKCAGMPVNLCLMEKLDNTLDDLLDDGYDMCETEWFSMFFQVAFGLAIAQKYFNFVHNDLHSSNVMFKATPAKNLYFQVANEYYKIPTYGKITKIIDFARGTFKLGENWIFSDQFKDGNDAFGQYDYPVNGNLADCDNKPNPSFDLVRLGTTVITRLESLPVVRKFVEDITLDDYDNSVCYDEDTFQLYMDIAHHCHNAVPIEVITRPEFERFKVKKEKIPKGCYIFVY